MSNRNEFRDVRGGGGKKKVEEKPLMETKSLKIYMRKENKHLHYLSVVVTLTING